MHPTTPEQPRNKSWSAALSIPSTGQTRPSPGAPHMPGQWPMTATGQGSGYQVVVSPKSAGVAVLLTFLWLGAGHLYNGKVASGVTLMVVDAFLVLLFLVPIIGWVLAPMIWIPLFIVSAITANNAANDFNRRIGYGMR